jgi:hypothetical protein
MTYDLIDDSGAVLFSGSPYADALAEQKWRSMAGASSLQLLPHGKAKSYYQPPLPLSAPTKDL